MLEMQLGHVTLTGPADGQEGGLEKGKGNRQNWIEYWQSKSVFFVCMFCFVLFCLGGPCLGLFRDLDCTENLNVFVGYS